MNNDIKITLTIDLAPFVKSLEQARVALEGFGAAFAESSRLLEIALNGMVGLDVLAAAKARLNTAGLMIYWFRTWLGTPALDVLADLEDFPLGWDLGWRPDR